MVSSIAKQYTLYSNKQSKANNISKTESKVSKQENSKRKKEREEQDMRCTNFY